MMHKYLWLVLCATLSFEAVAKYRWYIERAERSCTIEQNSMTRSKNGTPACVRLKALLRLQYQYDQ